MKKTIYNAFIQTLIRTSVFFALLFFEELVFHFFSVGSDYSYLPIKIVLCIPTSILLAQVVMYLPTKAQKCVEPILIGLIILYYSINLMYHSAFKVYFSIKLIDSTNTKIVQYYREILDNIVENIWVLMLMILVPVAIYIFFRLKKIISYNRTSLKYCYTSILCFAISVSLCVGTTFSYGKEIFSPYDLMVNENIIDFSFPRLGVLATAEIEIKEMIAPANSDENVEFEVWQYEPNAEASSIGSVDTGTSNSNTSVVGSSAINGNTSNYSEGTNELDATNENEGNNGLTEGAESSEPSFVTSPNILDIDFVSLAENETNTDIANIHKYFASVEPSYKNQYTGMFEGYNLIFLTCEAFCPLAVDEELTPTLYKLVNEGFVFNNFYNPRTGGSTSDGEFVCSTSLVPTNGGATNFRIAGQNSMPFSLGNMFNRTYGITSRAYHNNDYTYYDRHKTYPGMGYYYTGVGNGLEISYNWPASDLEMMQSSIPDYIDDEMFHVYYMTVSGHKNYNFGGNAMSQKHREEVDDLPYSDACKAYIACQMELDAALEYLIEQLEEKGIVDKTVICFTGDHWPYGLTNEEYSEILGHEVEPYFELYKSNLVLWSGSIEEPIMVDKYCSSMDILPTLLNLFGFDFDSRLLMGRDILSDTDDFVIFVNRSFITDKVMFNSQNGQIIHLTGSEQQDGDGALEGASEELPDNYISDARELLNNRWKYSQRIMDTDYYKYICEALGIEIPVVEQNYSW